MKLLFSFLFALLFCNFSFTQIEVGSTIFDGHSVKVYPYRTKSTNSSTDNRLLGISENIDIPYCPLNLPDGEYVVFYEKETHYDKYGVPVILKGDTDDVATLFSIRNHKKNGEATWFYSLNAEKKIYLNGSYLNDLKSGEWKFKTKYESKIFHYKNDLLDGSVVMKNTRTHLTINFSFAAGLLNGKYSSINSKSKDKTELEFVDGYASGNYYCIKHKAYLHEIDFLDIYLNGNYENAQKYKSIEVKGSLLKNLKYGSWQISTNDYKVVISYDTTKTENPFLEYEIKDFENEEGDAEFPISVSLRRQISLEHRNYLEISDISPQRMDQRLKFLQLIQMGYGYFIEYDNKGNIINQDSFNGGEVKIPFAFRSADATCFTRCKDTSSEDSVFILTTGNTSQIQVSKLGYIKGVLSTLETIETSFEKGKVTDIDYRRKFDYYRHYKIMGREFLMLDSTVSFGKYGPFVRAEYLHLYSGYIFPAFYNNAEMVPLTRWKFDSANLMLSVFKEINIGDLKIIDTVYKRVQGFRHFFESNDLNWEYYAYRDRSEFDYDAKFFPDSMHLCFLWKNELLNGFINFHIDRNSKKWVKASASEDLDGNNFFFENNKNIKVISELYSLSSIFGVYGFDNTMNLIQLQTRNGQLSGYEGLYFLPAKKDANPIRLASAVYLENIKNGYQTRSYYNYVYPVNHWRHFKSRVKYSFRLHHEYVTDYRESREKLPLTANYKYSEILLYADGKKEGVSLVKEYNGQIVFLSQFKNNHLNGEFIKFNPSEQPVIKCHFENDTLNGIYEDFNDDHELINTANFQNGLIHGLYNQYQYLKINPDAQNAEVAGKPVRFCNSRKVNTVQLKFDHGYLVDTAKYYHCDGILKASIIYDRADSIKPLRFYTGSRTNYYLCNPKSREKENEGVLNYSSIFSFSSIEHEMFYYKLALGLYSNLPGHYKYFYKSGVQSQEGRVSKVGKKTGWWKFWNENGVLMKEIQYEKGYIIDPVKGIDTIKYSGKIKGYYPNGKFMMEGYVLDEDFKYECVQDEEIAYQEVYYTRFVDEAGNEVMKNYSGIVRDYHINGNRREEGQLQNGERNGIWRTFESNGNMNSIGSYTNNLKEGLWLYGDLSGIGFVDNQCFEGVMDINKIRGNLSENHLEFQEIYYNKGVMIKSTTHNVELK